MSFGELLQAHRQNTAACVSLSNSNNVKDHNATHKMAKNLQVTGSGFRHQRDNAYRLPKEAPV